MMINMVATAQVRLYHKMRAKNNSDDKHKIEISSLSAEGSNIDRSPKKEKLISQKFSEKRF